MRDKQRRPDIGANIRKCREIRNYTQHYIANELDISTTAYRNIESGKTALTMDYLYAIAEILAVNINALLHYDEQAVLNVYNSDGPANAGILPGAELRDMIGMLKTAQEKIMEMADQNSRLSGEVNTMVQHISNLVLELAGLRKQRKGV